MRRKLYVATVLVVAFLVWMAVPASAATQVGVSSNTTASDLSAGSITNADVERGGEYGYVGHDTYRSDAVLRWAFDEGSGTTAYDHVNSHDASFNGDPSWTPGVHGQALKFDGSDDYVQSAVSESGSSWTVSIWKNTTNSNIGSRLFELGPSNDYGLYIIQNQSGNGGYSLLFKDDAGDFDQINNAGTITYGEWVHLTAVYDGSALRLYKNGNLIRKEAADGSLTVDQLVVGARYDGTKNFNGQLDDARVYSTAFSPGQVRRLAAKPNVKLSSTATERWAFDEGQGAEIGKYRGAEFQNPASNIDEYRVQTRSGGVNVHVDNIKFGDTTLDDFEDGDVSDWSGSGYEANASKAAGRYSLYGRTDSTTEARTFSKTTSASAYGSTEFLLRTDYNEFQDHTFQSSGSVKIHVGIGVGARAGDAGSVIYYNGTDWVDTGLDVTKNDWYRIEIKDIDYSTNTFNIRVVEAEGGPVYGDEGSSPTVNGDPVWTDGRTGSALSFDGSDDSVDVPTSTFNQNEGTWMTWVKGNFSAMTNGDVRLYNSRNTTSSAEFRTYYSNAPGWIVDNSSNGDTAAIRVNGIQDNQYTHLAFTWEYHSSNDTTVLRAYRDGAHEGTSTLSGKMPVPETTTLGKWRSDNFPGEMDDFRLYSERLTGSEIRDTTDFPGAQVQEASSYQNSHAATNTVEGWTDLELHNASATVTWEGSTDGGSTWSTLGSSTFSTTGNHSITWSEFSGDDVRVTVDIDPSHPDHTARLHGEGVIAQTKDPSIDDSSLTPNTTAETADTPVTLEANVSDADFATSQGDKVVVDFYVDGEYRGNDTLTANGTASYTLDSVTAGNHDWHVEATDSYNNGPISSATAKFKMPGELRIYHENDTSKLVDSVEVEIRFYGGSDITVSKSTSNGKVDMSGLPADEEFVAVAKANGYYDRRIYVSSLVDQQRIYLLPETSTAYYNVFQINDLSGSYPPGQTRLIIQRGLNVSGEFQWTTISGDFFGATNEHETNLRAKQRYRLIIENDAGDRRVIGSYTATDEKNPKVIDVESIIVEPPSGQSYHAEAWIDEDPNPDDATEERVLRFSYTDKAEQTESINLVIHERGNSSNKIVDVSTSSVGSSWTYSYTLTGNETEKDWMVNWTAERSGGEMVGQNYPIGERGQIPIPMDPKWLARFVLVGIPVVGALANERYATIGAIGLVIFTGVLMTAGIYDIPAVAWFAGLVIAVGGHALQMRTEGATYG